MIDADHLKELVKTYENYGWMLRQVITTDETSVVKSDVPVGKGVVDAAWFSRPPTDGPVAWEIRFLGSTQYALVEHLDENSPDFEQRQHQIEQRLADAVAGNERLDIEGASNQT